MCYNSWYTRSVLQSWSCKDAPMRTHTDYSFHHHAMFCDWQIDLPADCDHRHNLAGRNWKMRNPLFSLVGWTKDQSCFLFASNRKRWSTRCSSGWITTIEHIGWPLLEWQLCEHNGWWEGSNGVSYLFVFGSYLFVQGQRGRWDWNGLSKILSPCYKTFINLCFQLTFPSCHGAVRPLTCAPTRVAEADRLLDLLINMLHHVKLLQNFTKTAVEKFSYVCWNPLQKSPNRQIETKNKKSWF